MNGPLLTYRIRLQRPNRHQLGVELEIALPSPSEGQPLSIQCPGWRPGRYYPQAFAAGINGLQAYQADGTAAHCQQTDGRTWQVQLAPGTTLFSLRYTVAAHRLDAGRTFLSPHLLLLNPITFSLYPVGWEQQAPVNLVLEDLPPQWAVSTALARVGPGQYAAPDFHTWVDSPLLAQQAPTRWAFEVNGCQLEATFFGSNAPAPAWQEAYQANVAAVVREQVAVWGQWPLPQGATYHLQYILAPGTLRHAVEHTIGALYVLPDAVCESEATFLYGTLGITSHELFHTWNVKRLRPSALVPYRYEAPALTDLHWFTEGLTCYYEELCQVRAGVIDRNTFFARISETLSELFSAPGSQWLPVADQSQRSLYAESTFARPDGRVSFYDSGQIVALALDLQLRLMGAYTLDGILRKLYAQHLQTGFSQADLLACLHDTTGADWQPFFDRWLHTAAPPDLTAVAKAAGLLYRFGRHPRVSLAALGVEAAATFSSGIRVDALRENSALTDAGLPVGALLTEINGLPLPLQEVALEPGIPATLRYTYWGKSGAIALPGSVVQGLPEVTLAMGNAPASFLDAWLGPQGR